MTPVAKDSDPPRDSPYQALICERSPSFDTFLRVVSALGLKLSAGMRSEAEVT
jgi:DNA-binding phage protein